MNRFQNTLLSILLLVPGGTIRIAISDTSNLEGYYTEEEVRAFDPLGGPDKVVIRKSWYAGDKMKKDEAWYGTTIVRFDLDKIWVLDAKTETYIEASANFIRKFSKQGLSSFGIRRHECDEVYFPDDLYIRTESNKVIGPWQCYQVITNPKYRDPKAPYAVFWYSTDIDFPVDVYGEQLKQLFGKSQEVEGLFQRLSQFEGYPVRTEAHGTTFTTVTTLMKIQYETEIDPKIFDIPEGYNGVPLPEDLRASGLGEE